MDHPATSLEGALYDLVARGKKDTFFMRDAPSSVNLFDTRYEAIPPSIAELRLIVPRNRAMFGSTCEFEIEKAGDLLIEPTLLIQLPTWLPPPFNIQNKNTKIQDLAGHSYGYVNGIAYFLFEKIQFYQDTLLLQEYSGDSLFALRHLKGSYTSAFLDDALTGVHDGSPLAIQRAATPTATQLRLRIPLPFCQHSTEGGLPLCATESQQFRLKVTLRKLEDLIEISDPTIVTKPSPFGKQFVQTLQDGTQREFTCLDRYSVGDPTIYFENRQIYLDTDDANTLAYPPEEAITTFSRLFENTFTFGTPDYAPLPASPAIAKRLVDGRHPAEQMVWYFRSGIDQTTNRLWNFANGTDQTNPYYTALKFTIAGKDREQYWPSLVWQDIEQHAKQERYSGRSIGSMNWSYGEQHAAVTTGPTGTLNFTSADRPWIYVNLAVPVEAQGNATYTTQFVVVVDGYGTYAISNRRGGLLYAN